MSVLFQHAMRYEWMTRNPILLVRQSALPVKEEIVLTPVEVAALLAELRDPFSTLILLAAVTGLRRGELFGLKWEDINFAEAEIQVVRSVVDQVEGPPKTLASRRPLPLPQNWRQLSTVGESKPVIPVQRIGYLPVRRLLADFYIEEDHADLSSVRVSRMRHCCY
jgi:integrase